MSLSQRLVKLALAVLLLLFGSLPMGIAAAFVVMGLPLPPVAVPVLFVLQLLLIAFFLWLGKWQSLLTFDGIWWQKSTWLTVLGAVLAMWLFSFLGDYLIGLAGQAETANQEALKAVMKEVPVAFVLLAAVIGAPLGEELLCRGLIPAVFSGRLEWLGHVLATLLFALLHGPTNLGSWVAYGGMGLVLALVRYKTGRLEYSVLAHFVNNLIALLSMLYLT